MLNQKRKKYSLWGVSVAAIAMALLLFHAPTTTFADIATVKAQQEPTPVPFEEESGEEAVSAPSIYIPMLSLPRQQPSGQGDVEDQSNPDNGYSETETEGGVNAEASVVRQGELAAQSDDIGRLASEVGLSTDQVASAIAFQQLFGRYADELIERYPNQISSVRVDPVPSQRGHILFVDQVPEEVNVELSKPALTSRVGVAKDDIALTSENVVIAGNGRISMAEHASRTQLAAQALVDQGYRNSVTFFNPVDNKLHIELQLHEGAEQPSQGILAQAVENRLQTSLTSDDGIQLNGEAAIFNEEELELTFITGTDPLFTPLHTRGGNWLYDDGVRECTSGWSVRSWYGSTGIMTAGHCTGLNRFKQPGLRPYPMRFIRQVSDLRGDVEYHTTTHWELAEFYANANSIRTVKGIRPTNTMVGAAVCVYGRTSNRRTCNHTIEAVGMIFSASGYTLGNQARASNNSLLPGDSGGGWSWGNTAYGVTTGYGYGKSYFTTIQEAQSALRVTVLTK